MGKHEIQLIIRGKNLRFSFKNEKLLGDLKELQPFKQDLSPETDLNSGTTLAQTDPGHHSLGMKNHTHSPQVKTCLESRRQGQISDNMTRDDSEEKERTA